MSTFGDRLRALRTERNLHQSELGELLELSASAIGSYERNLREPSYLHLVKIADLFKVSTDFLLCRTYERLTISDYLTSDSRELEQLLSEHSITLNGKPLTDEDKQKLFTVSVGLFWEKII